MSKLRLVLVPGLLCDAALWNHQIRHLGEQVDVVVADVTGGETMAELAGNVLRRAGEERFALAGLSMGGYVCFEILRQAPGQVERLALIDTSPLPDTAEQSANRKSLIRKTRAGQFHKVARLLTPTLIHPARVNDARLMEEVTEMARRVGAEAFLRQQSAVMRRPDSRPLLPRIEAPTLVLCGRQDGLTPLSLHEEMARAIPRAKLVAVEECGHLAPMERPEEVTAALRVWLQS